MIGFALWFLNTYAVTQRNLNQMIQQTGKKATLNNNFQIRNEAIHLQFPTSKTCMFNEIEISR